MNALDQVLNFFGLGSHAERTQNARSHTRDVRLGGWIICYIWKWLILVTEKRRNKSPRQKCEHRKLADITLFGPCGCCRCCCLLRWCKIKKNHFGRMAYVSDLMHTTRSVGWMCVCSASKSCGLLSNFDAHSFASHLLCTVRIISMYGFFVYCKKRKNIYEIVQSFQPDGFTTHTEFVCDENSSKILITYKMMDRNFEVKRYEFGRSKEKTA